MLILSGFSALQHFFSFVFVFLRCYCCGVREKGKVEVFGNISLVANIEPDFVPHPKLTCTATWLRLSIVCQRTAVA